MMKRLHIFWKLSAAFMIIIVLVFVILTQVNALIVQSTVWAVFGVILAIILSGGANWYFVNRYIKRPVRRLITGMNNLAEKQFDYRLDEEGHDEFSELASSFNDMASMLSSSLTELQKTRDYLQSVLESSADIIIIANPTGTIRTFTTGAENALGYRRRDVIGEPIDKLFADPHERIIAMEKLKYTDNVVNYETKFITRGGETRTVLLTLSRLRNSAGEIIGMIGIGKDITEEKRLQKQLMQSERLIAIGQVFTGIQHSMKNMLNACKGGAYMVKTGLAKDDRTMVLEGWDIVQEGILRMTDMSVNMLKYVKEWIPRMDPTDLAQTLADIDRVISKTAEDKGVVFQFDIPTDLPPVLCDGGMIHSAVMDIVSNAIDACLWKEYREGEKPKVSMRAYVNEDGQMAVIEVEDNGIGMTDDVKTNIFTPFFSTKSKAGTGLGLSIVSRMIGVHGGTVDVESEPNIGTTFRLVLPIHGTKSSKE